MTISRLPLLPLVALLMGGCASTSSPSKPFPQAVPLVSVAPPKPPSEEIKDLFVFRFQGLTPGQINAAKGHPSYHVEELPNGVVQVAWDPRVPKDWEALEKQFGGWNYGQFLYNCMAIKTKLGKTQFTHGGLGTVGWGGCVFKSPQSWLNAGINFDDQTTHNNEIMLIHGVLGPSPEEVRHEMLRNFAGTNVHVEKCGDGYVVVSRAGRGVMVTWQINDQSYALIYNSYDKEMVAAYVNRLGSMIPRDFQIALDVWVRDEIQCRFVQIDWLLKMYGWSAQLVDGSWRDITQTFPQVYRMKGLLSLDKKLTSSQLHEHLLWVRQWLWANRENFKYDDETRGFILKGPDRYDPAHPPELPEELNHLPPPDYQPPKPPDSGETQGKLGLKP